MNTKEKIKAIKYLVKTWSRAMPGIFYRSTFSLLFDPKGSQEFLNQVLDAQALEGDDKYLNSVEIDGLFADRQVDILISGDYYKEYSGRTITLYKNKGQ